MRIIDITNKFVNVRDCRGADMVSRFNSETTSQMLTYKGSGDPIAEIYEYKSCKNFRLRLFPNAHYSGRISHNHRLHAVLQSIQMPDTGERKWDLFRYSTFIRYSVKVYDRKLNIEYELKRPMEFIFRDGRLTIDYAHLESLAFPEDTAVGTVPVPSENSNLNTITMQLNAILAGV